MRAVVVITARLGSSRLPGKMLRDLRGRPVLAHVVDRMRLARRPDGIVLATTREPADDALEAAARELGIAVFRGPTEDVLVRWRDAMLAHGADLMVGCDGDDVLCDAWHVDRVIERAEETGADHVSCVGLPFGMAPTGYSTAALERVCAVKTESNTEGQGRFFADPALVARAEVQAPAWARQDAARLTLDYPEDLAFFDALLAAMEPYDSPPPLERIVATLNARPDIVAINAGLQEEYWRRFNERYPSVELRSR
jgi:spore coat polysaccharide biosynthesis protein SpsF